MTLSIRKFLLINLLLAITVTTTLTVIGNYYLDQKDIQRHLDTLMAMSTLSYQALLGDDLSKVDLNKLQQSISEVQQDIEEYTQKRILNRSQVEYAHQFSLQVWSDEGKLLLRSPNAPDTPLSSSTEGFSDETHNGHLWRVFTAYNPKTKTTTIVGERYVSRNRLGHMIARDDIYIMLMTFPLSGLLIWIIIGKGLSSLHRVEREVSNRAPNYLEPVEIRGVPVEIKPVVAELNQLFLRLQEAFDREKRFAADAAHELRTPLAALKAQAQVILKAKDPAAQQEAIKKLIHGVERTSHLVQQLLTLSRLVPEATIIEETTEVDLGKIATEVIAQLVPEAIEKNIEIEFLSEKEDARLVGNATALSILMRNLVDNAIRYTPKGGKVTVSVTAEKRHVLLSVTDNGPGIPPKLRGRVFERFFRVLGTKAQGSGLGLAIVAQIAKLHQAKIKLDTPDTGKGLEVTLTFPKSLKR